jgi:hypothetical protein
VLPKDELTAEMPWPRLGGPGVVANARMLHMRPAGHVFQSQARSGRAALSVLGEVRGRSRSRGRSRLARWPPSAVKNRVAALTLLAATQAVSTLLP